MVDATLPLNYNRDRISRGVLGLLEQAARRVGLDLESTELLGQEEKVAVGFITAERQGLARSFLGAVDFEALRLTRHTRENFRERLQVEGLPAVTFAPA